MDEKDNLLMSQAQQYIEQIKSKTVYHNELPKELQEDPVIIRSELIAGIRSFGNRGFDVIRNNFFVTEIIQTRFCRGNIYEKEKYRLFNSFGEYYEYLDGDIYTSASYYQYEFTKEEVVHFGIDLSKINRGSFVSDTLPIRSKVKDMEEEKSEKKLLSRKASLLKQKERFLACNNLSELVSVAEKLYFNYFCLSSFALYNPEKNIPLVLRLLFNNLKLLNKDMKALMVMLCVYHDDDGIFDYFPSQYRKRKSEVKAIVKKAKAGELKLEVQKYYDYSYTGFYCLTEKLIDENEEDDFYRVKGEITHYYETFEEFLAAVDNDLSSCDLTNAIIPNTDFSKYKTNAETKLPLASITKPFYAVTKQYVYRTDEFVVTEVWRVAEDSPILKIRKYTFKYFCDFVAFLNYDLSNADLLMCDGLCNVKDFSGLNFTGAILKSDIRQKIGLVTQNLTISVPLTLESTMKNEMVEVDETALIHTEISSEPNLDCKNTYEREKIYYISDLHLPHHIFKAQCQTKEDIEYLIHKTVVDLTRGLQRDDILIIAGDISGEFEYFKLFIRSLKSECESNIIVVLGNHELWNFEGKNFSDIVAFYQEFLNNEGVYLLQNNIVYRKNRKLFVIAEDELLISDVQSIRAKLISSPLIIFGGLAFAGQNSEYNADQGLYKNTISRKNEISESLKFEGLYSKVRAALADREVVVATHNPLEDWSQDVECHEGFVYVSGHTHRNKYFDDGVRRIYADNQVGYYRKNAFVKYFYMDGKYDSFVDYNDGIYEISEDEYVNFYRGKNISITFSRDYEKLFMLKRNGYYCFIIRNEGYNLSILNGGSTKKINERRIEDCYDAMSAIIEKIKTPLDEYNKKQKLIANFVKAIGGEGIIHGAIVDIDFYNHIYVNPIDLKITGYYAKSMVDKIVYGSLYGLLQERRPDMISAYNCVLSENATMALILKESVTLGVSSSAYYSTDIYKESNLIKKMQRLHSNVLAIWPEKTQGGSSENANNLLQNTNNIVLSLSENGKSNKTCE